MAKLLLGFICGILLSTLVFFLIRPDQDLYFYIDRLFDQDVVYMKDGSIIKGWIKKEKNGNLIFYDGKTKSDITQEEYTEVKYDMLSSQIKELM